MPANAHAPLWDIFLSELMDASILEQDILLPEERAAILAALEKDTEQAEDALYMRGLYLKAEYESARSRAEHWERHCRKQEQRLEHLEKLLQKEQLVFSKRMQKKSMQIKELETSLKAHQVQWNNVLNGDYSALPGGGSGRVSQIEHQLETLKADTKVLIEDKERRIWDLKSQISKYENSIKEAAARSEHLDQEREDQQKLLERIEQTMRVGLTLLKRD